MKKKGRIIIVLSAFIVVAVCVCTAVFIFNSNKLLTTADYQTDMPAVDKSLITSYEQVGYSNLRDNLGNEYTRFANGGIITGIGTPVFVAPVIDDSQEENNWSLMSVPCGVYSLENDKELVTIMRIDPESEWTSYYRRVGAPKIPLDYDKCSRFEFIRNEDMLSGLFLNPKAEHSFCNDGITKKFDVSRFILSMKLAVPEEFAGYVKMYPDGKFKVCYSYGEVYGFFKGENSFAMEFVVMTYAEKKYTIAINNKRTDVLSERWLKQLQAEN